MEQDVAVGMGDDLGSIGDDDAAQLHGAAAAVAVDVVAHAHARHRHDGGAFFQQGKVLGMGDLDIGGFARHYQHGVPVGFHKGGIVRGRASGGAFVAGGSVGGQQGGQGKALGGLHGAQPGTGRCVRHKIVADDLYGIRDGKARDDGHSPRGKRIADTVDQGRAHEGAGAVMHQHVRGFPGQGGQAVAHGVLTFRAAGHGQPGDAGVLVAGKLFQASLFFFQAVLGEDKNKARHGPGTGQRAG